MIGWTLFRYFAFRYLITVGWFMLGITALVFIADFTTVNERFAGITGYNATAGLTIAALRVLMILQQTIPFVALFASMALLIQLNRKYELVIARAAGLSAWQFLSPLCLGALFFGYVTILLINPIATKSFAAAEEYQSELTSKKAGASNALLTPWIRQIDDDGDVIIGAKALLKNGTELRSPVFILLNPTGTVIKRIDAKSAKLGTNVWTLTNATTTQIGKPTAFLKVLRIKTTFTPSLLQERFLDPEMVPIYELPEKIAVAKALGYSSDRFSIHFHSILALPALLVVMTLIASIVTLKFVRFGQSSTMILGGILAGFMLYVVTVLVKAFGGAGIVPPVLAAWLPVTLGFLFGISFLLHTEDG